LAALAASACRRVGQPLLSFLDVAEVADDEEEAALLERAAADPQPAPIGEAQLAFKRRLTRADAGFGGLVRHSRAGELLHLAERRGKAHAGFELRREAREEIGEL
jgi:hypothetical protein